MQCYNLSLKKKSVLDSNSFFPVADASREMYPKRRIEWMIVSPTACVKEAEMWLLTSDHKCAAFISVKDNLFYRDIEAELRSCCYSEPRRILISDALPFEAKTMRSLLPVSYRSRARFVGIQCMLAHLHLALREEARFLNVEVPSQEVSLFLYPMPNLLFKVCDNSTRTHSTACSIICHRWIKLSS